MTDTQEKKRITFVKDPTTNTIILTAPDGRALTHIEGGAAKASPKPVEGEYVSAARMAMERIKSGKTIQARTHRVECHGTWYVRKLSQPEIFRIGMLTNRDENGRMDLLNTDDIKSFTTACLHVAVASDEVGRENAFATLKEASDWANEIDEDITETVGKLFGKIIERNPKLIEVPRDLTPDEEKALEKKSESNESEGGENTTSPT